MGGPAVPFEPQLVCKESVNLAAVISGCGDGWDHTDESRWMTQLASIRILIASAKGGVRAQLARLIYIRSASMTPVR